MKMSEQENKVYGFNQTYQTEEREALMKQGLNEKTAASVLLKLFISGNEICHTTDAP